MEVKCWRINNAFRIGKLDRMSRKSASLGLLESNYLKYWREQNRRDLRVPGIIREFRLAAQYLKIGRFNTAQIMLRVALTY